MPLRSGRILIPSVWVLLAVACEPEVDLDPSAVSFLVPTEGESYPAGDLTLSIVVENFGLVSPEHTAGEAEGYIEVSLDGGDPLQTSSTTPSIAVEEGEREVTATLFYSDGDPVEPEASASVNFTVTAQ
jgi:hypothetical protein